MFEKFGEFDSAEELNRAAAAQRSEGDIEALAALAEENGIDREDVQDYIDGFMNELVNPWMAAEGKLKVEKEDLQNKVEIIGDWMTYLLLECQENDEMCRAVRRKGKSLRNCIAGILEWSLKNAEPVDQEILKACKITYKVTLGIPGAATAKRLIREYYLGG